MPYFKCRATKDGKTIVEELYADNKYAAIRQMLSKGMKIVSVVELVDRELGYTRPHGKAKLHDLLMFAREMAVLIENGIPVIDAIDGMCKNINSRELLKAASQMKQDLEAGATFKSALAKHPRVFGYFWDDMVEAGEMSGQLPRSFKQISKQLEMRAALQKKVISALIYPVILIAGSVFAIFIFVFMVIPVFKNLFDTFKAELPFVTRLLLRFSDMIQHGYGAIIVVVVIIAVSIHWALSFRAGRKAYENLLFRIPFLGNLSLALAIEKFSSTLGVLLESGIPITRAMEISGKATQSVIFADRLTEATNMVIHGVTLSDALQKTQLFPPLFIQLVSVGERTGRFSDMLKEAAKYYDEIVDTAITRFSAMLEPFIMMIMAVVIGFLVVALFMPIFSLSTIG